MDAALTTDESTSITSMPTEVVGAVGRRILLLGTLYRTTPPLRVQKFPCAISFSTYFSSDNSATNLFSRPSSFSNSFKRFAGATSRPDLQKRFLKAKVKNDRVVVDGNLVTSAGGLATYEGALWVVGQLFGQPEAKRIAAALVFGQSNVAMVMPVFG